MIFDAAKKNKTDLAIVIGESSQKLTRVYEKFFKMSGLNVIASFSDAGDMVSSFRANSQKYSGSIVLLDSRLSQDTDGLLKIASELKQVNRDQKIILAIDDDGPLRAGTNGGEKLIDGLIRRPFTISELLSTIEKVSSPIKSVKGSKIFTNPKDVESLVRDIQQDSKVKLCSVRSSASFEKGNRMQGRVSSYVAARSKGLKVFMITEVRKENLTYYKYLMMNLGVELRHLDGVIPNFAIWDEKHLAEMLGSINDSFPTGIVLYSNLESDVKRSQYSFDAMWKMAIPAEIKIKELEAKSRRIGEIKTISGIRENLQARLNLVNNATFALDACYESEIASRLLVPEIRDAYSSAVKRGVRVRHVTEITDENLAACKELISLGIEMRHLSGIVGAFAVNDTEFDAKASADSSVDSESIYSNNQKFVEQNRSVLNKLWNSAVPASQRIKEIEEEEEEKQRAQVSHNSNCELSLAAPPPAKELGNNDTDSFIAVDTNWKILFVNDSEPAKRLTKAKGLERREDLVGKDYWEIFSDYRGTISEENLRAAMEKREIRRWKIASKLSCRMNECVAYPAANGIGIWALDLDARRELESSSSSSQI